MLLYQILASTIHEKKKVIQKHLQIIQNIKNQLQREMVKSNYLVAHILYQILKNILNI